MPSALDVQIPYDDSEFLKNLLQVLDLILNYNPKRKDKFSVKRNSFQKPVVLGRRSVQYLNETLLNHRFEESCKLLWLMSQEKTIFDMVLYKGIMVVLENLQFIVDSKTVWNFFSNFQNLIHVFKKEAQIEYIIYALKNDIPDLHASCQDLISQKQTSVLRKHPVLDILLHAYQGLIDYVTWKKYMQRDDPLQLSRNASEKAVVAFKNLVEQPGIWDIFILKLVEMLEFYEDHDEIRGILEKYVEKHPDHLNAYIYLCEYLHKNDTDLTSFIHYSKMLAKKCPSDARVLLLVQKWNELGRKRKESLNILFMFLDYPLNVSNLTAWELLLNLLSAVQSSMDHHHLHFIKTCWKLRRSSWNIMNFPVPDVPPVDENMKKLYDIKDQVQTILETILSCC